MEFEELKVYKDIWYFGQNANKNYSKKPAVSTTNSGYDDELGNYKIVSFFITIIHIFQRINISFQKKILLDGT